jgi:hypothetical protein
MFDKSLNFLLKMNLPSIFTALPANKKGHKAL